MILNTIYNWKMGGEAGYGIMNTGGPIFAKTLARSGLFVFIYSEYPSLIRGGHNTMQVTVVDTPVNGSYLALDQLLALNAHTIIVHQNELKAGGTVLYDSNVVKFTAANQIDNARIPALTGTHTVAQAKAPVVLRPDVTYLPIALEDIALEAGGSKIMRNVVAVGASLALFARVVESDALVGIANQVLADIFKKKGEEVIKANQQALVAGYEQILSLS